jgi:hypothetical protein
VSIGIAGDVCEHMTDGPAWQPARVADRLVIDGQDGGSETPMRLTAPGDGDFWFRLHVAIISRRRRLVVAAGGRAPGYAEQ